MISPQLETDAREHLRVTRPGRVVGHAALSASDRRARERLQGGASEGRRLERGAARDVELAQPTLSASLAQPRSISSAGATSSLRVLGERTHARSSAASSSAAHPASLRCERRLLVTADSPLFSSPFFSSLLVTAGSPLFYSLLFSAPARDGGLVAHFSRLAARGMRCEGRRRPRPRTISGRPRPRPSRVNLGSISGHSRATLG